MCKFKSQTFALSCLLVSISCSIIQGSPFPESYQFSEAISFQNIDLDTVLSWSLLTSTGDVIDTCTHGVDDLTEDDELAIEVTFQGEDFDWMGLALSSDNIMEGSDGVIGVVGEDFSDGSSSPGLENGVVQYSLQGCKQGVQNTVVVVY